MMDGGKPKEQLRRELEDMQQRIAEFGKSKAEHKKKVEKEMGNTEAAKETIEGG